MICCYYHYYILLGWDGCRNRDDGNPLLNQELQYIKPYARAGSYLINLFID